MGPSNPSTNHAFATTVSGNLALAVVKLAVGALAGSRVLIADGWHSMADVATHGATWIAYRISRRPPDDDHHYGHGPVEALAGSSVGFLLLLAGGAVMWSSWTTTATLAPGFRGDLALGAAVFSIVANLVLARLSGRVGRKTRSQGLVALARDNAADALSSVIVLGGLIAARNGYGWAEPVGATCIGLFIIYMGYKSLVEGLDVLMDRVVDPGLRDRLKQLGLEVEGVRDVQRVRVHPLGSHVRVDMDISVDGQVTVESGHRIAHEVEQVVIEDDERVEEVSVHVNPWRPTATTEG